MPQTRTVRMRLAPLQRLCITAAWATAVLALLLAQSAAGRHALDHGMQWHAGHAATSQVQLADDRHAPHAGHGELTADTWGHSAGSAQCALLDHLLVGNATGAQATAQVHVPPASAHVVAVRQAPPVGQLWRAHQARGPPAA
jgi:hypothetical protein